MKILVIFAGLLSVSLGQHKIIQHFELLKDDISVGSLAMPNEFPYQVGLSISKLNRSLDTFFTWCSGSLINYKIVVTAASCLKRAVSVTVLIDAYNLRSSDSERSRKAFTVQSTNWVVHSDYSETDNSANIAVIRLPEPIFITATHKIHLNRDFDDSNIVGQLATTSGWGRIGDAKERTSTIHFSNLKILSPEYCEKVYNLKGEIPLFDAKTNFCVDGSICPEDFGSPLVFVDPIASRPTLIGLASFGNKNGCNKEMPTVFTRISSYSVWFNTLIEFELSAFP